MSKSSAIKPLLTLLPLSIAALLLGERPAGAVLNYYIYESGGNVVFTASGSLNLPSSVGTTRCGAGPGCYVPGVAGIQVGSPDVDIPAYSVLGPATLPGTTSLFPANAVSGLSAVLYGGGGEIGMDGSYVSGAPFVSSATFNGMTLAGIGITTTGLVGTWTLVGTGDTINVVVGAPSAPPPAPGPLPLFGAAAAFSYSRRLRRRVSLASSSGPLSGTISP